MKKPSSRPHAVVQPEDYAAFVRAQWSEKRFLAEVIKLAHECGWESYHTHDSRRSEPDFPDLVFYRKGGHYTRVIVAELKVNDNEPTPGQYAWLAAFAVVGIGAYLWRPEDWPAIVEALR